MGMVCPQKQRQNLVWEDLQWEGVVLTMMCWFGESLTGMLHNIIPVVNGAMGQRAHEDLSVVFHCLDGRRRKEDKQPMRGLAITNIGSYDSTYLT